MVAGDEENEAENVGQSHELLDELFARFDVSVGKLQEQRSIAIDKQEEKI